MSDAVSPRRVLVKPDAALIVGLGFLQGLAVFGLNHFLRGDWPLEHPWLTAALWGLALFLPPTAQWLIHFRRERRYWLLLGGTTLAILAACWEHGRVITLQSSQSHPETLIVGGALAWAVMISLASAAFGSGWRDYPNLFRQTCRTVLLPLGALLFTLVFTLLLWLWGALFELIGITFFKRLFFFDWFIWPLRGAVFGVATFILLERPALMDGIQRAGIAIASALLPVIVVIHLLFLAGLLFVGLGPLWATRHATQLVLTLLIVFTIMVNGAHEDGANLGRLPRFVAILTRVAIWLSPIYVAIAEYSLALRVMQYGWSPDRVVSACIIAFVGFVVLTYVAAALRGPWATLPRLALPNLSALLALVVLSLAVNSPILSPLRIAAASQEQRILSGQTAPNRIDWATLAFDLGRYGRDALSRLASAPGINDGDIRKQAAATLAVNIAYRYTLPDPRDTRSSAVEFVVIPGNTPAPADLVDVFRQDFKWRWPSTCETVCKMAAIDLNQDGEAEMIVLAGGLPVYHRENGRWRQIGHLDGYIASVDADIIAKLGGETTRILPPEWSDLDVDGRRLRLRLTR